MKTITTSGHDLRVGDEFTIAGVNQVNRRTRWQRFRDWLLRRPARKSAPQVFRVTEVIVSKTWPDYKAGKRGEFRIDTLFEDLP